MKRKRQIESCKVYKHKARLNLGGHKQEYRVHYHETYSPVVRWTSIRLMLILSIICRWSTQQFDFVMAYPQADISTNHVYIEIPKGFEFEGSQDTHCLHVLKNIYSGKDPRRTWNQYLVKGLKELGFEQSSADECVFYQGTTTFMVYVDHGILVNPDKEKINCALRDLQSRFEVQDKGDLSDYLGVKVQKHPDVSIEFTQLQLVDSILDDLQLINHGGSERSKSTNTPASTMARCRRTKGERSLTIPGSIAV
jgi:Reverse transcriptase (RNA-dependent DNA polymerase)